MRYLPLTDSDRGAMLAAIGADSVAALFCDVPLAAALDAPLDLPRAMGEIEVERALARMAAKNLPASAAPSFLGCGVYRHHIPAAVDHLIQRGEFLTSYTPYQPEVSRRPRPMRASAASKSSRARQIRPRRTISPRWSAVRSPVSSCRIPAASARCATSPRSPRLATGPARCSSSSSPRRYRWA
jgi:Glycine cleavage system P-protein